MTSETYFPDHRHLLGVTTIRRARMLPDAANGDVEVARGARVSLMDTVARGIEPSSFKLVDAAKFFGVNKPDALEKLLRVSEGDDVEQGDILGQKGRKKLLAPTAGKVVTIWRGQIVIQRYAETVDLLAGLNGTVIEVRVGRGAVLEGYGGVMQGMWGNGKRAVGSIRLEPASGIEGSFDGSGLDTSYRGAIIVTRRTLRPLTLDVIEDQGLTGIIAPSIAPSLRERALQSSAAILLLEGFGTMRISASAIQFLESMEGRQAALDAVTPAPLESRRPELLINVPFDPGDRPSAPNLNVTLRPGIQVRLARGDAAGAIGVITNLPKTPILMDNGLRVSCAQVELVTGEKITAPLANLEVTGA